MRDLDANVSLKALDLAQSLTFVSYPLFLNAAYSRAPIAFKIIWTILHICVSVNYTRKKGFILHISHNADGRVSYYLFLIGR